jgi:Fe-S oxidoreductase
MCPSYRVTREEQHLTRGRANTLRLALSGQLERHGTDDPLASREVYAAMDLCVSCKGCRRECPTGVDMAKMKVEFLHHYRQRHGMTPKDRLVAYLPRYASLVSRFSFLANPLQNMFKGHVGFAPQRSLPAWSDAPFFSRLRPTREGESAGFKGSGVAGEVMLLADTFNNYFEPENLVATMHVLEAAGYHVHPARPPDGGRPLCCGRTFLAGGLVDEARAEARRTIEALRPALEQGMPIIGLEPSCLLGLRDEFLSMLPGGDAEKLAASACLFEEFLAREAAAGRLNLRLKPLPQKKALLHGHCHQKAFAVMPDVQRALELVPGLAVETIESSCCGMAGSFGYDAGHYEVSMKMAELSLLPAVRAGRGARRYTSRACWRARSPELRGDELVTSVASSPAQRRHSFLTRRRPATQLTRWPVDVSLHSAPFMSRQGDAGVVRAGVPYCTRAIQSIESTGFL